MPIKIYVIHVLVVGFKKITHLLAFALDYDGNSSKTNQEVR